VGGGARLAYLGREAASGRGKHTTEDMAEPDAVTIRILTSLDQVSPEDWDACAGDDNPFVSHAFLAALERSGSAIARTGWGAQHLAIDGPDGRLVGALPMYLKSHSYGEYVFDHSWAAAYERAGGHYYPKLQVSVPFTPATGPRLLVRPGVDAGPIEAALIAGSQEVARRAHASSVHVTFLPEAEAARFEAMGFLVRTDQQFHWENRGYGDFDDFLESLNSRKRKQTRKERRDALADGIEVVQLTGADLKEEHWDAFFRFYIDTGSRKWGSPYLNRKFFRMVHETMADRVLLVMARRGGRWIAGALNFIGRDTLYGRNWGCTEDVPFLHFECCYYQAIDFAIARGLARVEAGAQGAHKLARGYLPRITYSVHWLRDSGFHEAVARYLERERAQVEQDVAFLADHAPFRHEQD
jgi:predicted N-acyltransferase